MTCNSKTLKNLLFILLLWAWPALALGVTPPIPDHPAQYVVDLAGVLDAEARARLNARLKALEAIEVGYGLESTLPDSLVGSIGREYLAPNFRKGDYAGGLEAAATEIINKLTAIPEAAASNAEPTAAAPVTETPSEGKTPPRLILLAIIIFIIVMLPMIALIVPRILWTRKRGSHAGFWGGGASGGSGGGSSWGSSGSSGSSDFSGGGGDFGGGGASGDW
ncbi:MAG: TPM domain-containing protein [Deltaproteobacteria bacterium]|nr:TPM domain-containing protein [Deltaproteobacteria bacterium]